MGEKKFYLVVCHNKMDSVFMLQQFLLILTRRTAAPWRISKREMMIFNDTSKIYFRTGVQITGMWDGITFRDLIKSPRYRKTETFETRPAYDYLFRDLKRRYGQPDKFLLKILDEVPEVDG